MTIMVAPIDARGRIIQMVIVAAGQACLVHRFFLGVKIRMILDQQVRERAFPHLDSGVFKKLQQFRFAHQAAVIQRQRQGLNPRIELSLITRGQFCQIRATQ